MKLHKLYFFACLLFGVFSVNAQMKQLRFDAKSAQIEKPVITQPLSFSTRTVNGPVLFEPTNYKLSNLSAGLPVIRVIARSSTGRPIAFEGRLKNAKDARHLPIEEKVKTYLSQLAWVAGSKGLDKQHEIVAIQTDNKGEHHIKVQQKCNDLPIFGAELTLHTTEGDIDFVMGRTWPTESIGAVAESEGADHSLTRVWADMGTNPPVIAFGQWSHLLKNKSELGYLPVSESELRLVYHHSVYKNAVERWEYFVDAFNGEVVKKYQSICKFHNHQDGESCDNNVVVNSKPLMQKELNDGLVVDPLNGVATATAQDLYNINRTINTYQVGSKYYMIDGSRSMFKPASSMPNDPQGVIWTIDAFNTAPQNSDFNADHITSNNNTWSNKTGVSAHYNGGKAYDYFKNVFGRNSISGSGGNIVSFINIADEDGSSMGNAFWNGAAMFYGNGDAAFQPLAKGLDVAGHEMTHGVVQNTANLEYQGESGALNESFADVFGVLIDRDDWLIGEDVVKPAAFPSGALRSMQDPHNGASTNDFNRGWQPKKYSERFKGSEDNGGVHINSGIPNHAFFLFASSVGKDKAEKVYYKVLNQYLTKSSQFIDCRIAVIRAAREDFGDAAANAAAAAFDAVEVLGGQGGNYENNVEVNPGEDLILFTSEDKEKLYIYSADGDAIANPLTNTNPISKPSISDDGSLIVFVAEDQKIHYIEINWQSGTASENILQTNGSWRNAAISKDGTKLAALRSTEENFMVIFDLLTGAGANFELINPTFSTGITTGDVLYADAMEWDFSGEYVMYDAINRVESSSGFNIEFWDIGFIKVWNNSSKNFAIPDQIEKLFPALDEGLSVGNPTFSKNSPYIIAFDYLENDNYYILGANVEDGEVGVVYENSDIGYPSFSRSDDAIIFNEAGFFGTDLSIIELESDKITAKTGSEFVYAEGYSWGVWFSNGERKVTAVSEVNTDLADLRLAPNPVKDQLQITVPEHGFKPLNIEIFDLTGKMLQSQSWQGSQRTTGIGVESLKTGAYVVRCTAEDAAPLVKKFIKL
ncbi:MAG: M4 family metallopeptidase [Saprospiraceae bacterium]|nr:M4 family metallopeptidase [Saprospiraceae bacterium]